MDEAPPENGSRGWRPTVPIVIVVISVVVALVAVSALLWVLFRQTVGPGQVLRDFSRLLEAEDCPGSYALLDSLVQRRVDEDAWCEAVPRLSADLNPGFDIDRVVLEEGVATIEVDGVDATAASWFLSREDRSWLVLGASAPIDFPGDLEP